MVRPGRLSSPRNKKEVSKGDSMSLTRVVCSAQALHALIDRLDYQGTVEYEAFDQGRARLDWYNKLELSPLDVLDAQKQSLAFPPTGRWDLDADGEIMLPVDTPPPLPMPPQIKTVAMRKTEARKKADKNTAAKRRRSAAKARKTTAKVATST